MEARSVDLELLNSVILFCQVQQPYQSWDGPDDSINQGGQLSRTRGRQPLATSVGPNMAICSINFGLSLRKVIKDAF